ncbi:fatty acid desaturase [Acidisphaera sp. S103]|uniref:fatty acid desaturase n=1 Tax=Acidisphaera sp. S103 TaxID=1747223 RepID=UPI00131BBFAB|nr:fatty acid desaturase [Acidisphaera sp. S103]
MSGLSDRVLSHQELRALQGRSNLRGGMRLTIHLVLLIGAGWLVAMSSGWVVLPAMFLLGVMQVTLFAPAHETMHQTAFASRRANAIVGWLTSCPSLLNWHFYTAYHLAHHRHAQEPGLDPELGTASPASLTGYIVRVLGMPYWTLRLRVAADCWRGDLSAYTYISVAAAPKIIRGGRAMTVLMIGGSVIAATLCGWATPFLFWIGPQLLGQPPLRAYLLAEHTGCTQDRNGLTNTRTTLTIAPVRLLMWDMPYHAEHHLFPSIPFHRLADAHALIRQKLGFVQPGYLRWNWGFVRSLIRGASRA